MAIITLDPDHLDDLPTAAPGDVVHFTPGTYNFNFRGDNSVLRTTASGTAQAPIIYRADRGVVFTTDRARVLWSNTGSYVLITGFELTGNARIGIENYGNNVDISGNHIHHLAQNHKCDGLKGGGAVVQADWKACNNTTSDNHIHDIFPNEKPDCPYIHGIYYTGPGGYITGNLIYRCGGWGIHCYHTPTNITIAENTIVGCRNGGIVLGADRGETTVPADGFSVCRNRVFYNANYGIGELGYAGPNNFYDRNWIYGNPADYSIYSATRQPTNTVRDPADLYRCYL